MPELLCRTERVEHARNFKTEVRGLMDVDHLIERACIHRNMNHSHIHTILLSLFSDLSSRFPQEKFDLALFKNAVFSVSDRDSRAPRLHHKLQSYSGTDFFDVNQTWIVTYAQLDGLKQSHMALATLEDATNLGLEMEEARTVVLILSPSYEKHTKSAAEIARTFATLLMNDTLRQSVNDAADDDQLRDLLTEYAKGLSQQLTIQVNGKPIADDDDEYESKNSSFCPYYPFRGLVKDFKRRMANYKSDYLDGIKDRRSVSKVISTAVFLIFTILPTSIAYGMLNENNTNGAINVQKVVLGQWIGSLLFGIFGGQQLLILSTTAPLSIYIAVIYQVAQTNDWDFFQMYASVGIYAMGLLILASVFQLASLMKFTTRSTEEIFSVFIALALIIKAIMAIVHVYTHGYLGCINNVAGDLCDPAEPLLFIFLLFGTTWLSMTIISFRSSPYLSRWKRDLVSDYALPIAVLVFSFISFFGFSDVKKEQFQIFSRETDAFFVPFFNLPAEAQLPAVGLAIPLSILFFMDQLLVTNTVDNKDNKLKKGSAHHWDLLVVGVLNIGLSIFGLPWMHGALPSAYLHLKALSDVEDRLHNGYIQTVIVHVRETRLATLIAHIIMIPIYFFLVPHITVFIPTSIFNGVFLFMAFSSLTGNEFWERILLIFTEQRAYPPTHYIRRVPQRVVHQFTIIEFIQLVILVAIGFAQYHYVEMVFPIVIAAFIPFRHFFLPLFIRKQYLEAIDGQH
ncbi:Bicarbonate transporter-like transmembrane domain-containing protein [Caenorhabditis elegans]|uniref:Anion transporter ABTS-2 n=1 Tax=Caenorhabditis elegans TaxID=6239 RepID=G5EGB9_CAEEL|nr:Bicarbonate transporter-like transmembrane domain-containing protein [Caenorhabditis elegans]AAX34416.1 anion transporter ABTS-2 [Caenorhabditis elegans]CAA91473.4 Bicarbonate transporter-like transmembrane domain-containing protein [Caenorhabditis elegans]|eukprot:NP_509936.3 Anion/Bicarbonate TranSporter family [Caenorhabditis elegans]